MPQIYVDGAGLRRPLCVPAGTTIQDALQLGGIALTETARIFLDGQPVTLETPVLGQCVVRIEANETPEPGAVPWPMLGIFPLLAVMAAGHDFNSEQLSHSVMAIIMIFGLASFVMLLVARKDATARSCSRVSQHDRHLRRAQQIARAAIGNP